MKTKWYMEFKDSGKGCRSYRRSGAAGRGSGIGLCDPSYRRENRGSVLS